MTEDTYTHGHQASVLRSHTWRTIANSAAYVEPYLRTGTMVLDVGCGPGTISAEFAHRVAPSGAVHAVDVAPGIVAAVERLAVDQSLTNLFAAVHSGYDLGFDPDTFDVVHAHQVLQHVSRPVEMLKEFRRVVKPDGVVAIREADYAGMSWFPRLAGLDRWMEIYQQVTRRNDAEPDAGRHLASWARQAGFASVDAGASVWCFANPQDRAWWGGLWADRIVDSSLAQQAVDYGFATRADLDRCADAFRAWAEDPDGWFAVVNAEVLCR